MANFIITCPSGLSFEARRWKVIDRRGIRNPQILQQGLLLTKMLESIDQGCVDPGPYGFEAGKKVDWRKVCITDIIDALIKVRCKMRPMMEYTINCSSCGSLMDMEVDLSGMETTPIDQAGLNCLSTGDAKEFDVDTDEDGNPAKVSLRMLLGEDIPKIAKFQKADPETVETKQMVLHITELTPPGSGPDAALRSFKQLERFLDDSDWLFHEGLEEAIDSFGGGTDTVVPSVCKHCSAEQRSILPFEEGFFYPRKKRSRSSMALP